jgi:hypothetical protein
MHAVSESEANHVRSGWLRAPERILRRLQRCCCLGDVMQRFNTTKEGQCLMFQRRAEFRQEVRRICVPAVSTSDTPYPSANIKANMVRRNTKGHEEHPDVKRPCIKARSFRVNASYDRPKTTCLTPFYALTHLTVYVLTTYSEV